MRLGASASGPVSGRGHGGRLSYAPSGTRHRIPLSRTDCKGQRTGDLRLWEPEKDGGCVKEGRLFYHLRRQTDVSGEASGGLHSPEPSGWKGKAVSRCKRYICLPTDVIVR